MSEFVKKFVIAFAIIILFLFLALIGTAWHLGAFADVEIQVTERGPYNIVCLENIGNYRGIAEKIDSVAIYLADRNITFGQAVAIYFDDPAETAVEDLKSYGGFIVLDSVAVDDRYISLTYPRRPVVVARVEAHPMIAPFKTYPRIKEWLEDEKQTSDPEIPAMEIYDENNFVEVEISLINISTEP